jgi:hypothetical protein
MSISWCVPHYYNFLGTKTVFHKLPSPAAHPDLLKTHDGTPQTFISMRKGAQNYIAMTMYLHINSCPIRKQACENITC